MQTRLNFSLIRLFTLCLLVFQIFALNSQVNAQGFSGSDEDTYSCEGTYTYTCNICASMPSCCFNGGYRLNPPSCPYDHVDVLTGICKDKTYPNPRYDSTQAIVGCRQTSDLDGNGELDIYPALPLPPRLRQAEVWFWTIVYALWTMAGLVFTISLIIQGFQYMVSQGNPEKLAAIRKRISQWAIGLVLVFLAYPILATFFSLIGINSCITEEVELPGFQIFFGRILDPDARCT